MCLKPNCYPQIEELNHVSRLYFNEIEPHLISKNVFATPWMKSSNKFEWIGRSGPVAWPPGRPNLTLCDFCAAYKLNLF